MNIKLQNKLYKKYPILFAEHKLDTSRTRMCDGICCGNGWGDLIADACKELDIISRKFNLVIHFTQIKEKLGSLRIYITIKQPPTNTLYKRDLVVVKSIIGSVIHYAECQSFTICEFCGKFKDTSPKKEKNILYGVCDDCWKKRKAGR